MEWHGWIKLEFNGIIELGNLELYDILFDLMTNVPRRGSTLSCYPKQSRFVVLIGSRLFVDKMINSSCYRVQPCLACLLSVKHFSWVASQLEFDPHSSEWFACSCIQCAACYRVVKQRKQRWTFKDTLWIYCRVYTTFRQLFLWDWIRCGLRNALRVYTIVLFNSSVS